MFWHNTSDRSRVLPARGISAVDERELLQLNEGPPEAMSQHRSQRGGGVAAGGGSPGCTSADGEVRVGLIGLILGNPKPLSMAECLCRQRSCVFSRNTRNTSELWSSATTRSLSHVQYCRFLNCCCASLSVHACREPTSIERNCYDGLVTGYYNTMMCRSYLWLNLHKDWRNLYAPNDE